MANQANITVKKNDGTTDIVWTGVQPSSGDGTAAVWQSQTVGTALAHRPEFRLTGREASKGAQRSMRATMKYSQIATNSTTGVTSVVNQAFAATDFNMPKDMSASDVAEFVAQYANLLSSALIKQCVREGYSAT